MAKANSNDERTEREFQLDVNQAVANTEAEVFDAATGDEELENDGDTSLEEMGEGLEGDDLDEDEDEAEEETAEADKVDADAEEDEEADEEQDETVAADEAEEEEPQRDERGRFEEQERPDRREIPLRAERERRRQAEERAERVERDYAELRGRLDEIARRQNAPPPPVEQKQSERPDMFADPEGYDRWRQERDDRRTQELVNQAIGAFQQFQQQQQRARVDANLELAARGERGWEFGAAYVKLKNVIDRDPNNPAVQAIRRRIEDSPDPARELFAWWDENGGPEYREQVLTQLMPHQDRGNSRQRSTQPRHVTQLPESMRRNPPSLNSARGGQRHEIADPEMMDDSDDSVFRFAARR